jgi:hypothetical protein
MWVRQFTFCNSGGAIFFFSETAHHTKSWYMLLYNYRSDQNLQFVFETFFCAEYVYWNIRKTNVLLNEEW